MSQPRRAPTRRISVLGAVGALSMMLSAQLPRSGSAAAQTPASAAAQSPPIAAGTSALPAPAGVANAQRAWQNWTLNCQGCHLADGTGSVGASPRLAGTAAKFLWVPGGREYLGRVPGVAASPLSNADLAEVLNWMVWRFDREHLPATFQPFTAAEIGQLRAQPLRLEASQLRRELLKKAGESGMP